MRHIHKAWLVCFGCMLLFFCATGLGANTFSVYLPFIMERNGFTGTQTSSLLTARSFSSLVAMFLTAIYYKRFSLRSGMVLAVLFEALGFLLYGLAASYPVYLLAAAVVGMGYGLASMIPIGILLQRWFIDSISTATGICAGITGLSTLGIPSLITWAVQNYGLGLAFCVEGAIIALFSIGGWLLVAESPESCNEEPYRKAGELDGNPELRADALDSETLANALDSGTRADALDSGTRADAPDSGTLSATQNCRMVQLEKDTSDSIPVPTRQPVLNSHSRIALLPVAILIGTFASTAYGHLSILMTSSGLTYEAAAVVIAFSGIALTLGKMTFGWACDRFTTPRCNLVYSIIMCAGLFLCGIPGLPTFLLPVGIVLYSLGLGVGTVGMVIWARELSDPNEFAVSNRYFQISFSIGALLFSVIPGMIADHAGGSYRPFFLLTGICGVLVLIAIQWLYREAGRCRK